MIQRSCLGSRFIWRPDAVPLPPTTTFKTLASVWKVSSWNLIPGMQSIWQTKSMTKRCSKTAPPNWTINSVLGSPHACFFNEQKATQEWKMDWAWAIHRSLWLNLGGHQLSRKVSERQTFESVTLSLFPVPCPLGTLALFTTINLGCCAFH